MSHKLYRGGESPLVGDIVECQDISGVTGMLVYGKQYVVKEVNESGCVRVVHGQGGFYTDRFKLIRRKEFVLQSHFYQGGEKSLEGDVIECVYDGEQSYGALVTLGKQYVVQSHKSQLVDLVNVGGGFFQSRFKLLRRKEQEAPVIHEGPEQIMEIKESPMWRQKTAIKVSQALLISGIVVFWARMHGTFEFLYNMDWGGFMSGWYLGNPQPGQRISNLLGGVTRIVYEVCFLMGSATVIIWATQDMPTFIRDKFFGTKS